MNEGQNVGHYTIIKPLGSSGGMGKRVPGESLKDRIPSDGMDPYTFFATFIPLADAPAHAYGQGRIRREVI